jgi:hypothetical protein
MSETVSKKMDDFVATPVNNLIAVFHDVDQLNAAADELKQNGFPEEALRPFIGEEGIREMDFDGSGHGLGAELLRYLQHIGPARAYLDRYQRYMRDGDCLLMVRAPEKEQRKAAADILRKHSDHPVTYFGPLTIEEV